MSLQCVSECQASIPMSVSGSSAASESPESEHAVSVLDFAERYAADAVPQSGHPRSSASRRKRQRDDLSYEDKRQGKSGHPQQQTSGTVSQFQSMAVSAPAAVAGCHYSIPGPTTYYVAIYNCLVQWCCRLKALQPKCVITKDVLHRTMDLFHRYREAIQISNSISGQRQGATAVHLAACLWVASKNDGNRACVPSRTLLTKAIAVCPEDLTKAEVTVCCKLRWNLFNSEVASELL